MLYRSIYRFCRQALHTQDIVPKELKWHLRNGKFCIENDYPDPHIFYISPKMDFGVLLETYSKFNILFDFPQGINAESNIIEFLADESKPKTIKLTLGGAPFYIKNQASFPYFQSFKRVMSQPDSIFNSIQKKYYNEIPLRKAVVLTNIQKTFMKELSKLPPQTVIDQSKRGQLMVSVMNYFKNDTSLKLWHLKIEELKFDIIIEKLNDEIEDLKADSERKYQILKKMIAAVSVTHILVFGYAIFFVDWLGWDIMEPLTYTVGIFGAISAMIFYLVHHRDSSGQTVKEIFKRYIMKNSERIKLEQKIAKRDFFILQRQRILDRMKIYKMRVDYGYFRDSNDLKRGQLRGI